jgi:hypothetical protein
MPGEKIIPFSPGRVVPPYVEYAPIPGKESLPECVSLFIKILVGSHRQHDCSAVNDIFCESPAKRIQQAHNLPVSLPVSETERYRSTVPNT